MTFLAMGVYCPLPRASTCCFCCRCRCRYRRFFSFYL